MRSGQNKNYNNNTHQKKTEPFNDTFRGFKLRFLLGEFKRSRQSKHDVTRTTVSVTSQHTHYILFIVIHLALQGGYPKPSITPAY